MVPTDPSLITEPETTIPTSSTPDAPLPPPAQTTIGKRSRSPSSLRTTGTGESLSRLVYEELKRRLNAGSLHPGDFLDLAALDQELGMSRTPLRDALIRLELEGFVIIYPRRGVMVRTLGLTEIRNIYEIIGALEAQAALSAQGSFTQRQADRLDEFDLAMRQALGSDDFSAYYEANLAFHNVWLDLSPNTDLVKSVRLRKERLYDFPRRSEYVREWELASVEEHRSIARCFRHGDFGGAATLIRDVHWSYSVQEPFIRAYYLASKGADPAVKTASLAHAARAYGMPAAGIWP